MNEYLKEKLKVDLDLFKLYVAIILVLSGGLVSLYLRDKFGEKEADYYLLIWGCVILVFVISIASHRYLQIIKDLKKLKKEDLMLIFNVFKLNALFTFEFFVLICAIFLLAYINKEQLNKWYKYGAYAIIAFVAMIIICTAINICCRSCYKQCNTESCYAQKCDSHCRKACCKDKYCTHEKKQYKCSYKKDKVDKENQESAVSKADTSTVELTP